MEARSLERPVEGDLRPRRRRHGMDALEERLVEARVPAALEKGAHQGGVGARASVARGQDLPGLRGHEQRAPRDGPVQGLDAEAVAGQHQPAPREVGDGDRPHPVEALEAALAPRLVGREEHFGVALGVEMPAPGAQLVAQRAEVVDLAVECDPAPAVRGAHRLARLLAQVEDAQPAEADHDRSPLRRHRVEACARAPRSRRDPRRGNPRRRGRGAAPAHASAARARVAGRRPRDRRRG